VAAYVLSWVAQWAWAWIDDSEVGDKNWLAEKISLVETPFAKWKYPVYNAAQKELDSNSNPDRKAFGFAKDPDLNNKSVYDLVEGRDYLYTWRTGVRANYVAIPIASSLSPVIIVVCVQFYPVALTVGSLFLMAHMARFGRRHKKLFDKHLTDKDAHKA
jgi:hypothetical protein